MESKEAWPVTIAASLAGPIAAVLHESGSLSVGPSATLWPIGFIVAVAVAGTAVGGRVAYRTSRSMGAVAIVPNLCVIAFYGFLLLFFGLGGSR